MSFQGGFPRTFSDSSIRAYAPALSGVYGISNGREWILIEATNDIQAELLRQAREESTTIARFQPTGFSYEICDAGSRNWRRDALIRKFVPKHRSAGGETK